MRIAIVGAGPAGLIALHVALDAGYTATAFEARPDIGGIWDPSTTYDALTTNLPHPLMCYPGHPFPASTPLFPRAETVRKYLHDFADEFKLREHIRLSSEVSDASWDPSARCWVLTIGSSGTTSTFDADLLLVCNGHYNVPRIPNIPSSPLFSHSKDYRRPIPEFGSRVLVVGGGPSGMDITTDLITSPAIHQVLHSSSSPSLLPQEKIIPKPRTVGYTLSSEASTLTVEFADGTQETGVTHCILATGFEVSFPFLSSSLIKPGYPPLSDPPDQTISSGQLFNTTYSLFPLYKHLFPFPRSVDPHHAPPPTSIAFLALLVRVAPLPIAFSQARLAIATHANSDAFNWSRGAQDTLDRWDRLANSPPAMGIDDEKEKHRQILKSWHRFEPMDQYAYRDEVDALAEALSGSSSRIGSVTRHRVRDWERRMYAEKDLIRRTWRYIERTGKSDDWVRNVGSEDQPIEEREREWVEVMERVMEYGRKREEETGVQKDKTFNPSHVNSK